MSCSFDEMQDILPVEKDTARISLKIATANQTRSSVSPQEETVSDLCVLAYRAGVLEESFYFGSVSKGISIELTKGAKYSLYAVANMGELDSPPVDEDNLAQDLKCSFNISDLSSDLPMSWYQRDITISDDRSITIYLERLVSKVWFSLDSSLLGGLTVTSVRLCQSATTVHPFSTGSKAGSSEQVADGDYASESDLMAINHGYSIYFYTAENCQGDLLPDNTDPWQKTPESLGTLAEVCTYLEVDCEFNSGEMYDGTVKYRFYIGEDNVTNFDIRRNTDLSVGLCLTGEGIRTLSWKVDPDVTIRDGFISGWIEEGYHGINDLYVGEKFYYGVEVAPELLTHLGGDLSRCSIVMMSADGSDIRFDEPYSSEGSSELYVTGTCIQPGSGSLWICDPDGAPAAEITSAVKIQVPKMVQSFYSSVDPNDSDIAIDEPPYCYINGPAKYLHIYFTDKDGYNLNTDYWWGFDLSLFTFDRDPYKESDYEITGNIIIELVPGTAESDGPAATYMYSCVNDGMDTDVNYDLSYAISELEALTYDIDELNYNISGTGTIGLSFYKITLTVVDNGWAEYYDCQLSLKVNNKSNMPLTINAWQVNQSNDDWNAISRNQFLDDVNNNMTISRASYITNAYYDNDMPLYGYGIIIYSERNQEGDPYMDSGEDMVYPLDGLETDDCYRVQMVDKHGQEALHHLFDVRMPSRRLYSYEVEIVDNLEDGSRTYSIIYGDDPEDPGWNNKGMWLHSNDVLISKSNTSLDSYNNITARKLWNLMGRYDTYGPYNLTFTYDSSAGQLYASCPKGNVFGITLDVNITGTVDGYVQTTPNGTWGKKVDNNCSATISKTLTGVTVGTGKTSIDGGAMKAGMDAIYAQTFYDSHNMIGSSNSYQHAAHPTNVTVVMRIKVNSAYGSELYPITVTWSDTTLPYYHSQDGKTYNPTFTKSHTKFDFVRLKRK